MRIIIAASLLLLCSWFQTVSSLTSDCETALLAAETFINDHSGSIVGGYQNVISGLRYESGALIRAIKRNDATTASCLLLEDIDINYPDPETGKTALIYAAELGMTTIITELLSHDTCASPSTAPSVAIKVSHQDKQGNTALHWLATKGHDATGLIGHLDSGTCSYVGAKNLQNVAGDTPLMIAARLDRDIMATGLLSGGSQLIAGRDIQNNNGDTALMIAARAGNHAMVELLDSELSNIRCNLNLRNRLYNQTALMIAAKAGFDSIVRLLINAGADPNVRGAYGNTALDFAISNGHVSVAQFLMDRGAMYRLRGAKVTSI